MGAIDTFSGNVSILGEHEQDESWIAEGHCLAWHMSLRPQVVTDLEQRLKSHVGAGMATGDELGQTWAALEVLADQARFLESFARAAAEFKERTAALLGLCSFQTGKVSDEQAA